MEKYHALIILNSFGEASAIKQFHVLDTIKDGSWSIAKIEIDKDELDETIDLIQSNLVSDKPWYAHIYNELGSKLIVIFKNKVFTTDSNKNNWNHIIEYGLSLDIPEEQLDFKPSTFKNETF